MYKYISSKRHRELQDYAKRLCINICALLKLAMLFTTNQSIVNFAVRALCASRQITRERVERIEFENRPSDKC